MSDVCNNPTYVMVKFIGKIKSGLCVLNKEFKGWKFAIFHFKFR